MSKSVPFPQLQVIDTLEIGPVLVEKQRFVAPYRVTQNGETAQTELIFKYESDVFEPGDPDSQNLVNMIAAQVALNYGIFCKKMVFRGYFDSNDQQFLTEMADNTATEIYVNKLLHKNPFLRGVAENIEVKKENSYLQAELSFPDSKNDQSLFEWEVDSQKYAVLSSGGKDSLLSYGLLNELGYEVHPVFGNESGRHWFTALNSYRYFKQNINHTGRVWMNSDRVFNWMLRQLPFIRKDFASVRADIYPIRLWTVAVFIFAKLPIVKKRKLGRLIIGDEYDTTWQETTHGINHYSGLYDQSIWFDNALSAYFEKKKWNVLQLSILRPLAELLILKILTQRYPDLQQHQVSCHAAHNVDERIKPCGKCEKCRRIVGMLLAFGGDPKRCGYNDSQIEAALKTLVSEGIHQESEGYHHLLYLLSKKQLVSDLQLSKTDLYNPQVMNIRFHPERSPQTYLPRDIREQLLTIYREYANGISKWENDKWIST